MNFSEEPVCRTLPVSCFSNLLKSPGWLTVIYFFFGHFSVFWEFFTSVRVTLDLLAINVEKPLRWRLQTCLFFCFHLENIYLFDGDLLLRQLSIQSINKFQKSCQQNSLDARTFSAIFHLAVEVGNCALNCQTRVANKNNLKEFSYRTGSFKHSFFLFCARNRTAWEAPYSKLNLSSISNQC